MKRKIFYIFIFAISMAYFESSVVVYLRQLYYPEGFAFPIKQIPTKMAIIELGREASTILMLIALGVIAGKNFWQRFSYFMITFGVWDIFYYIWLKIFIDWPCHLLTLDLLFLIPLPWSGPVLSPIIVSLSLVIAGIIILIIDNKGYVIAVTKKEWVFIFIGAALILFTYLKDGIIVMKGGVPREYNWFIFAIGELIGILIFIKNLFKTIRKREKI